MKEERGYMERWVQILRPFEVREEKALRQKWLERKGKGGSVMVPMSLSQE